MALAMAGCQQWRVVTTQGPAPAATPDAGLPTQLIEPSPWSMRMLVFGAKADRICAENYKLGLAGQHAAVRAMRRRGASHAEVEGAYHYPWAEALRRQYRMLGKLHPPQLRGVFRHWRNTSLVRSKLQRAWGDGMAANKRRLAGHAAADLPLAKAKADQIAQRLPFNVCGTPDPNNPYPIKPPARQDPPTTYTAQLPVQERALLDKGMGVYWHHEVAGRVVDLARGTNCILVEIRLKKEYARRTVGAKFQLFRAQADSDTTWLTIIPSDA
jgi:hypothetical protein